MNYITLKIVTIFSGELGVYDHRQQTEPCVAPESIAEEHLFDLHMAVSHIVNKNGNDNLVAHINVGEKYHEVPIGFLHF